MRLRENRRDVDGEECAARVSLYLFRALKWRRELEQLQENPEALDGRLLRYRRVLSFVACCVLSNHEEAANAVRHSVYCRPPMVFHGLVERE
jgi:hypothetical protein